MRTSAGSFRYLRPPCRVRTRWRSDRGMLAPATPNEPSDDGDVAVPPSSLLRGICGHSVLKPLRLYHGVRVDRKGLELVLRRKYRSRARASAPARSRAQKRRTSSASVVAATQRPGRGTGFLRCRSQTALARVRASSSGSGSQPRPGKLWLKTVAMSSKASRLPQADTLPNKKSFNPSPRESSRKGPEVGRGGRS
jgi:hypothetical protein